jgi:hypothetical protein
VAGRSRFFSHIIESSAKTGFPSTPYAKGINPKNDLLLNRYGNDNLPPHIGFVNTPRAESNAKNRLFLCFKPGTAL